jgi:hypothetical protein
LDRPGGPTIGGMRRLAPVIAVVLGIAACLWLLLRDDHVDSPAPSGLTREQPIDPTMPPALAGAASEAGQPRAEKAADEAPPARSEKEYSFLVSDWRSAPVGGATVHIDRETVVYGPPDTPVERGWRPIASTATDTDGKADLRFSTEREGQHDGPNLRIRVTPPSDRDDIAEAWRMWAPQDRTVYEFTRSHVIGGRVTQPDGGPAAGAQVFVGRLSSGSNIRDPAWLKSRADAEGRFVVRGIPTAGTFKLHVWAVGEGTPPPETSADIANAQEVVLDTRTVELTVP